MGRSNDFLRLYYAGNIVERIDPTTCSRSTRYVKHWIVVLTRGTPWGSQGGGRPEGENREIETTEIVLKEFKKRSR
jgi:hypothetical protein